MILNTARCVLTNLIALFDVAIFWYIVTVFPCFRVQSQESLGKQHMDAVRMKAELEREEALHREKSAYAKELDRQLQVEILTE